MAKRLSVVRELFAASIVFALITFVVFWPVFLHPTDHLFNDVGRNFSGDGNLVLWAMAWVSHALWNSPASLFNANIMHPAPDMLARSEHFFAAQIFFAPLYACTGNPVFATQGTVFLTTVACGVAMYALLRHWQAGWLAALFGGFIYAFYPKRYANVHALHVSAVQYLPLVILFFDRTLNRERIRWALLFAAALLLQMLCSFYLAFGTIAVVGTYAVVASLPRLRRNGKGVFLAFAATLLASAGFVLTALPYLRISTFGELPTHDLRSLVFSSAHPWISYLGFRSWGQPMSGLYVGVIPLVVAVVGFAQVRDSMKRRFLVPLGCAVFAAYLMSLGPDPGALGGIGMPYDWAYRWVPGFSTVRVVNRLGFGVLFGVAVAAGLGCDRAVAALRLRRVSTLASVTLVALMAVLVAFEYGVFSRRPTMREVPIGDSLPPVYRALAEAPPGAVVEIPADSTVSAGQMRRESRYTMLSTSHWKPILNGYTGYGPPTYRLLMRLVRVLPNKRATFLLARYAGLRYVVIHRASLRRLQNFRWARDPYLPLIGRYGMDDLFEVPRVPGRDLDTAIRVAKERGETIGGTPLRPLSQNERASRIRTTWMQGQAVARGLKAFRGAVIQLELVVENKSTVVWPAFSTEKRDVVSLTYRWEGEDGEIIQSRRPWQLPYDMKPSEGLRIVLPVVVRPVVGRYDLIIGLQQNGEWFPHTMRIPNVRVHESKLGKRGFRKQREGTDEEEDV